MELTAYKELIKHLPYKDQAFETKRSTWKSFGKKKYKLFMSFYEETFIKEELVTISRGDLFSRVKRDPLNAVFSIILWGYPRGYTRGNNMARSFPLFLNHVEYLSSLLSTKKSLTIEEFRDILKKSKGIGLSTLSKLLYFFNIKMEGYRCLIMDARILNVLAKGEFTELQPLSEVREHNKEQYYSLYLKKCAQLSKTQGYKPDQLELFLFMFGNNLKKSL
jgi:hypothetical protein